MISTRSSPPSIELQLIRRERLALETQRLALEGLKRSGRLKQALSGLPLQVGDLLRERLAMFSGIANRNSLNMETTSNVSSPRRGQGRMARSFCLTRESGMRLEEGKLCCSPTTITSPRCTLPPSKTMESSTREEVGGEGVIPLESLKPTPVFISTALRDVASSSWPANTNTSVLGAGKRGMENQLASRRIEKGELGLVPRYLHYNLWTLEADPRVTVAEWTCHAKALPRPLEGEWRNGAACKMLGRRPDLFRIVCPVKVDEVEKLTMAHLNRSFVGLVLESLRHGFWPWASTLKDGYLVTHDKSLQIDFSEEKREFVETQLKHEQGMDRMSQSFGKVLLPGMYCMPQYVVPKPHSASGNFKICLNQLNFYLPHLLPNK